jgi:ankyrin repeat protein
MSRSGAASDLAKGKKFTKQLLYVQHVDKEKDTASTISEQSLHEYFLNNSKIFSDSHFSMYERTPTANVDILKTSLQDEKVIGAAVYTNPLPIPLKTAVTIHAFVVLVTQNLKTKNDMFYSMEKNGQYIVLQQSPVKEDVIYKLYDPVEKELVERLGPVKHRRTARGNEKELEYLIRAIWKTNQLSTKYNLLSSNCQNFAEFVFEEASFGGNKWSTWISTFVDRIGLGNKKIKPEFEADTLKYHGRKDAKFDYYKAMADGRRQDFEDLAGNLTSEFLNSVDSQGYTLLEWATVFSTSDWPTDQFLIEKGAEIQTEEGLFRRNVFFIALQYLPSNKESQYLSFDGINIHGVNQTGDSALHLALHGEKWDVAERILDQFPDYDVNVTNYKGETPLHLAVHPKCKMVLIKKILARTNSENVNAQDEDGNTALLYAMSFDSKIAVKELLKRKDVDVNLKNNRNITALYYSASLWKNIPIDLFTKIIEKSTDINAQDDEYGCTVLHIAIRYKSETMTKELLKRKDVDVNLKNNNNGIALHFACLWKDMPIDLFKIILEKSTDINAQARDGNTALHWAIAMENRTALEELLKCKDVDVNLKNNYNKTALHFAAVVWKNIPIDLFKKILKKSTDVNAQDNKHGHTALHWAIIGENRTAVEELLKRDDVDVNLKNNKNVTALHYASEWKNIPVELFRVILCNSTDVVNAQKVNGWTALHDAIDNQSETATKQLLEHNDMDVNLKNNQNRTALHFACYWKNMPIDLLRIILEKSTDVVNEQNKYGDTALHLAIKGENRTAVKELLKRDDVDVNLKNNKNVTALHYASLWKNIPVELFRVILEKSTDINAQADNGKTALHVAIIGKNRTAVEELLKHKDVDVNLNESNYNLTALHFACRWNDMPIDLFRIILEKSADVVNAQDKNGNTALHLAIALENRTAVEELLKRDDVKVNVKNKKDRTVLHLAAQWVDIPNDVFRLILRKLADVKVESGDVQLVNAQDAAEKTALHLAIKYKSKTATKQLLEREEVNMNLTNNKNQTALHLAAGWVDMPIDLFKKILIDKLTNVNAKDVKGSTALHNAIQNKSKAAVEELLKHKDVEVSVKNDENQTALNLCSEWKGIPANLFNIIEDKTTADENKAEAENEAT